MQALRLNRNKLVHAVALICGLALSACTRNSVVLVAPVAMQVLPSGVCTRPADGPTLYPGPPVIGFKINGSSFPSDAMAAGIRIGCAGIIFRVDNQGRAVDARLVSEFPQGYGFGAKGLSDLAGEAFAPGVTDPNWHFTRLTLRWVGQTTRTGPGSVPSVLPPAGTAKPWGLMS